MLLRYALPCTAALLRPFRPGTWACAAPFSTAPASSDDGGSVEATERRKIVNRLLYRSRQRGLLELDLLIGLWAEQELPRMAEPMLQQYAAVLDEENPDLFKWLTGQEPAPERLLTNDAYQALRGHVKRQLSENSPSPAQAPPGKEWVRGWDDAWRGAPHPEKAKP